tara:strand:+ start:94 stop:258 length:165 start_codon:yes stop_codon:yes gene_type:complete
MNDINASGTGGAEENREESENIGDDSQIAIKADELNQDQASGNKKRKKIEGSSG